MDRKKKQAPKKEEQKQRGQDVFRDSPLRYLGYANHIAGLLRPFLPCSVLRASNILATGYMFADVYDKGSKVNNKGSSHDKVMVAVGDAFIWQMLASVLIPGFTINSITHFTGVLLQQARANRTLRRTVPSVVGLCAIPLIMYPIDRLVDIVMDETYRKWF